MSSPPYELNIGIGRMLFGHCFGRNPCGINATRHIANGKHVVACERHRYSAIAGIHPSIMIDLISCNGRRPGQIRLGDRRVVQESTEGQMALS